MEHLPLMPGGLPKKETATAESLAPPHKTPRTAWGSSTFLAMGVKSNGRNNPKVVHIWLLNTLKHVPEQSVSGQHQIHPLGCDPTMQRQCRQGSMGPETPTFSQRKGAGQTLLLQTISPVSSTLHVKETRNTILPPHSHLYGLQTQPRLFIPKSGSQRNRNQQQPREFVCLQNLNQNFIQIHS